MRPALAGATLVEQDDSIAPRIEETPRSGAGSRAGAPVNKHHRFAGRIPALLEVDFMRHGDG
jgi:hypothetical protein